MIHHGFQISPDLLGVTGSTFWSCPEVLLDPTHGLDYSQVSVSAGVRVGPGMSYYGGPTEVTEVLLYCWIPVCMDAD